jgi:hypothetical protein
VLGFAVILDIISIFFTYFFNYPDLSSLFTFIAMLSGGGWRLLYFLSVAILGSFAMISS